MAKGEVSWKTRSEDGVHREVYAHHVGDQWIFYEREKRYDRWQPLQHPALEDWLRLLDGVQRRIARKLLRPKEENRLKQTIRQRYPESEI